MDQAGGKNGREGIGKRHRTQVVPMSEYYITSVDDPLFRVQITDAITHLGAYQCMHMTTENYRSGDQVSKNTIC